LCSIAALSRAQGAVALAGPPVVRLCGVEALLRRCWGAGRWFAGLLGVSRVSFPRPEV
jgi:hypothetical protein